MATASGLFAAYFPLKHEVRFTSKDLLDTGHCGIARARGYIAKMYNALLWGLFQGRNEAEWGGKGGKSILHECNPGMAGKMSSSLLLASILA